MYVIRIGEFGFRVFLYSRRMRDIKRISDAWEISMEEALAGVIEHGIDVLLDGLERKKT